MLFHMIYVGMAQSFKKISHEPCTFSVGSAKYSIQRWKLVSRNEQFAGWKDWPNPSCICCISAVSVLYPSTRLCLLYLLYR